MIVSALDFLIQKAGVPERRQSRKSLFRSWLQIWLSL